MSQETLSHPRMNPEEQLPVPHSVDPNTLGVEHQARTEALGTISVEGLLREEQISPEAAVRLARKNVYTAFYKAEKYQQFAPVVVSVIANHHTPEVEIIYPTAEQIKSQGLPGFLIGLASDVIGFFSPSLAKRFDNYWIKKAGQHISRVAHRAISTVETIGSVAAPKERFIQEMADLHARLLGGESPRNQLLELTDEIALSPKEDDSSEKLSLIKNLTKMSGVYNRLIGGKRTISAFAPEIIKGVEQFLTHQGVNAKTIHTPPHSSLIRRVASVIAPGMLRSLPNRIEAALTNVHSLLPEDGNRFRANIYKICQNITERSKHGENGQELTKLMLDELAAQFKNRR